VATSIENMQLSNLSILDAMKRGGDSTIKQKVSKQTIEEMLLRNENMSRTSNDYNQTKNLSLSP
jgi:hypothetical protein